MDAVLWGVLPYVTAAVLIGGLVWRYKYDQFGWTTRSTQLYESKLLRIASPLFHYALFGVLAGHLVGLFIPKAWTNVVVSPDTYHAIALYVGGLAGLATLVGIAMLIYRRRTTGPVFMATTANDKFMYVVLAGAIILGIFATATGGSYPDGHHHDYRDTVSVWFRSLLIFQPNIEAMAASTWQFKLHIVVAFGLFMILPFTRLVHAFTVPLHYLFRPYVVYRTRDGLPANKPFGNRKSGWAPVGTPDRQRRG
ncbi:MAG: respiratory nitrate reductase subunit gamma [Propionibacteriaceae bacterium]|nr:respiratory nitrate reductase subunit gamma [Propionibacteriaceae bacterium]